MKFAIDKSKSVVYINVDFLDDFRMCKRRFKNSTLSYFATTEHKGNATHSCINLFSKEYPNLFKLFFSFPQNIDEVQNDDQLKARLHAMSPLIEVNALLETDSTDSPSSPLNGFIFPISILVFISIYQIRKKHI